MNHQNILMKLGTDNPLSRIIPTHDVVVTEKPFRYTVIDDFFSESFYKSLCEQYKDVIARGFSEEGDRHQFTRFGDASLVGKYDAYRFNPAPGLGALPTDMLRLPEWISYFSDLFKVQLTQDELLSYHYHKIGGHTGTAHTDYSLCTFKNDPLPNRVNSWYYHCKYENDSDTIPEDCHQVMRSVTLVYYLNNECNGKHGGETAIYHNGQVVDTITPVNNRLFAFEVEPESHHGFLTNSKHERCSITQWFHQESALTFSRFNIKNSPW